MFEPAEISKGVTTPKDTPKKPKIVITSAERLFHLYFKVLIYFSCLHSLRQRSISALLQEYHLTINTSRLI